MISLDGFAKAQSLEPRACYTSPVQRRDFLTSTLGATLVAAAGNTADASAQSQPSGREDA